MIFKGLFQTKLFYDSMVRTYEEYFLKNPTMGKHHNLRVKAWSERHLLTVPLKAAWCALHGERPYEPGLQSPSFSSFLV